MPQAAIAAVGAAASIGGALISSSSTKKAANTAATAQTNAANQTNALAQGIYNSNTRNFQPFMQSGTRANALLDSFIYGGQSQQMRPEGYNGGMPQNGFNGGGFNGGGGPQTNWQDYGNTEPYMMSGYDMPQNYQGQPQGAVNSNVSPQSAWDTFRNSTNYQFRLGEGMNALNSGWAGQGALQSGAAAKDAIRYGQNFASNELGNYLGLLQGQQALGAGSASSLAGVGNDFLSSVTANNRMSADALSNAALLKGQANQNMYGGIANALGGFASSFGKGW